jgi:hypothetical protein
MEPLIVLPHGDYRFHLNRHMGNRAPFSAPLRRTRCADCDEGFDAMRPPFDVEGRIVHERCTP